MSLNYNRCFYHQSKLLLTLYPWIVLFLSLFLLTLLLVLIPVANTRLFPTERLWLKLHNEIKFQQPIPTLETCTVLDSNCATRGWVGGQQYFDYCRSMQLIVCKQYIIVNGCQNFGNLVSLIFFKIIFCVLSCNQYTYELIDLYLYPKYELRQI